MFTHMYLRFPYGVRAEGAKISGAIQFHLNSKPRRVVISIVYLQVAEKPDT